MILERTELEDGTIEEIVYLNNDWEAVEKAEATRWILHRYNLDGTIIESLYGARNG